MAAPVYTTNLITIAQANIASDTGTWAELSGHISGGAQTDETDYFIQGNECVSQSTGTKTGTVCGLQYDNGSNVSWVNGYVVLMWIVFLAPNAVETWANGGIRLGIGSTVGNMRYWNAVGSDFGRYPYGGWQNIAIDPNTWWLSADGTDDGTPVSGSYRVFGSLPNIISAVSKGNPHGMDAIRFGRATIIATLGQVGNYATFAGMASANDSITAKWGLFSLQQGSYLWKGLMNIGTSSISANFVDANKTIVIDDTPRAYPSFNRIEIRNSSSIVNWNNISFKALGTYSKGTLVVVDNVSITSDGCTFQDMNTFEFQSNSRITNTIFQSCSSVTSGGGVFVGSKFLTPIVPVDGYALYWNNASNPDGYLDDIVFTKGTVAHHAIRFGTSAPTSITLRGMRFTGFNSANGQNDSVLYISLTSGTVNIQAIETSGIVSYKSAGATVNITQGVVTKIIVKDIDTNNSISGARVLVKVADDSNFPYFESVSITGSGTTAGVSHSTHGLATGDNIIISGAEPDVYNGVYPITVINANSYEYTTNETIGSSPATGTTEATFAFISGVTDINGEISDQRVVPVDQPISGWVRKATPPETLYRQQPISDIVDSILGREITVLLINDES